MLDNFRFINLLDIVELINEHQKLLDNLGSCQMNKLGSLMNINSCRIIVGLLMNSISY